MPPDPREAGDIRSRVQHSAQLSTLSSFGLPARARGLLRITDPREFLVLKSSTAWRDAPFLILGGGTNTVFVADFPGLVVLPQLFGRKRVGRVAGDWLIRAAASESWHDLVCWTIANGWPGLENLALIPGTVGAAPIQNIGAYGAELADFVDAVEAFDLQRGEDVLLPATACGFGYRDSRFKQEPGRYLITALRLRLPLRWQARLEYAELVAQLESSPDAAKPIDARRILCAVVAIRQRKLPDPARTGNAGSFFKNPIVSADVFTVLHQQHPALPHHVQADGRFKLAAGWLIEQCGWRGKSLGPVGCYAGQSLVLVNHGGAQGSDLLQLASRLRGEVFERFGVRLEVEPQLVGGDLPPLA